MRTIDSLKRRNNQVSHVVSQQEPMQDTIEGKWRLRMKIGIDGSESPMPILIWTHNRAYLNDGCEHEAIPVNLSAYIFALWQTKR